MPKNVIDEIYSSYDHFFDSEKKINVPIQKRNVGYMFQSYALFPNMNVYENISVGLRARKVKDVDIVAQNVMKQFQISELASRYPKQLSGGQRQRLSIARAIAKNPKLLLCDEPTGALDSNTGVEILKLLRECTKDNTVVIVTHNALIADVADRVIRLKNGKIIENVVNKQPKNIDEVNW